MRLELELDAERIAPGEELTGRVRVLEGGRSRSLTVTVSFCERSPAFLSTPFARGGVLHEGDLATGQAVEFRYELPASALPSVRGTHGELFWQVEAAADEPGFDARASHRFDVVTGARS